MFYGKHHHQIFLKVYVYQRKASGDAAFFLNPLISTGAENLDGPQYKSVPCVSCPLSPSNPEFCSA